MRLVSLCVCALLLTASAAFAQFDSATVLGTVRDTSNAVVPGAKVTLTGVETGISIVRTSSGDGNYEFSAVKPGKYVVTAEQSGFAIALVDNVQVQVGARLRVDLQRGSRSRSFTIPARRSLFQVLRRTSGEQTTTGRT